MIDFNAEDLKFDAEGLMPAIVQDVHSGRVLMLAFMSLESLKRTIQTGETCFWSRSRKELWHKGETSGNTQRVSRVALDCDGDALLVQVEQTGVACHTGNYSCFHRSADHEYQRVDGFGEVMADLARRIHQRKVDRPKESYTTHLFDGGIDKILKKVAEEAGEIIIAAKNREKKEIAWEVADLMYHLLVMMEVEGVSLGDVADELSRRAHRKKKEN